MKKIVLAGTFGVLMCGCNNSRPKHVTERHVDSPVTISTNHPTDPVEPNIDTLRARLFKFFTAHSNENVFDTTDGTYSQYWGPVIYPAYTVKAGHLFNKKQFHAIVFYADERSTGMRVYVKMNSIWKQIFEDTTLSCTKGASAPALVDWNYDGMPDICMDELEITGEVQTYLLFLMDKSGVAVHRVKKFEDISNPEVDKRTGHIISWYVHGTDMTRSEYVIHHYKAKQIQTVNVGMTDEPSRDSSCEIRYFNANDHMVRDIYCPSQQAWKHVPDNMKKQVQEYF